MTTATFDQLHTTTDRQPLWRTGVVASAAAAATTLAISAAVGLEIDGEAIPALGVAQLTFMCSMVGVVLAAVLARRADRPRQTFVRTTVALTIVSLVTPFLVPAAGTTRIVLDLMHVVAAAIVIPALASRLRAS